MLFEVYLKETTNINFNLARLRMIEEQIEEMQEISTRKQTIS